MNQVLTLVINGRKERKFDYGGKESAVVQLRSGCMNSVTACTLFNHVNSRTTKRGVSSMKDFCMCACCCVKVENFGI